MKTAKVFAQVQRVTFVPEVVQCPHCHHLLERVHAVWRKHIITLTEVFYVVSVGAACPNRECPHPRVVYRSAAAEALSLPHFSYGLDVIAHIGQLRLNEHSTRAEIHRHMRERGLPICEREVQYLYEAYMLLLGSTLEERLQERRAQILTNGGMILSLDGVQPEKGAEQLWVVREVLTGTTLAAATLPGGDAEHLRALLAPLATLGLPILGVVSDGQVSIRRAVAALFPAVPHQLCHFHFLRDIALPTTNADRALKTDLKTEVRGIRAVEARVAERTDDEAAVITGYATALRTVLLEDGRPPLDLPGVAIYAALEEISHSLRQCVAKRRIPYSNVCSTSPAATTRMRRAMRSSSSNRPGCGTSPRSSIRLPTCPRRPRTPSAPPRWPGHWRASAMIWSGRRGTIPVTVPSPRR